MMTDNVHGDALLHVWRELFQTAGTDALMELALGFNAGC